MDVSRILYSVIIKKLPRHRRNTENYYFLSFTIPAIICLLLISPLLAWAGLWRAAWSAVLCALIISALLVLWRVGASIAWLQNFYQGTLLWVILYNAYYTGGVASPVMVWMGIVPILPLFTVSRRWSYVWLTISFSFVIAFYYAQIQEFIPLNGGLSRQELTLSVLMIGLLCITQIMLVITYDSANAQHIRNIKRSNSTLKNLSSNLQVANEHKDKFLSTVSHEMRTPLNALMGYLGLLRSTDHLPRVAAGYVKGAQNSAAHLLNVINDLLDFSQIQSGKLVLSPQTINLHHVLKETHDSLAPRAAEQGINFNLQLDKDLPKWVRTDPHRLSQIFINLSGNALKFTQHGSVITMVSFECDSQDAQYGLLKLAVHDTGIGIPIEYLQRIFEPFVQVQEQKNIGNDNSLRGNGLGLSITKNLITTLGGSIRVQSQVGTGSIFEVHLPMSVADTPQTVKAEPVKEIHDERIYLLVVDDHAVNRFIASATIKRDLPNAIIEEARNGTEAIEKMKSNQYDLVLMDLIMPDHSGVDVTRIIRSECEPPYSEVKVVALTANTSKSAVKDCHEVGISEVLPKPFNREVLIRTILQYAASDTPGLTLSSN
jgi:signal transduction histidine kinase/CheY-like chemotaxis protein